VGDFEEEIVAEMLAEYVPADPNGICRRFCIFFFVVCCDEFNTFVVC